MWLMLDCTVCTVCCDWVFSKLNVTWLAMLAVGYGQFMTDFYDFISCYQSGNINNPNHVPNPNLNHIVVLNLGTDLRETVLSSNLAST